MSMHVDMQGSRDIRLENLRSRFKNLQNMES